MSSLKTERCKYFHRHPTQLPAPAQIIDSIRELHCAVGVIVFDDVIVAVKVTFCPMSDGLIDEESVLRRNLRRC